MPTKRYEHTTTKYDADPKRLAEILRKQEELGWELVTIDTQNLIMIFKRPI